MFYAPPVDTSPAAVIVERESHYGIDATDEAGIVREMNSKGPADGSGNYWAYTFPSMTFSYDTRQAGNVCVFERATVRVTINIVYPEWTPSARAAPSVIQKWKALSEAIHDHEEQHARFARDEAAALVSVMRMHPSETTCAALDAYVQGQAALLKERHMAADKELDQRTDHGRKEGVAISW